MSTVTLTPLDDRGSEILDQLAVFATETGLRTNEWVALERRDVDRSGPAVLVQRRYADAR